MTAATLGTSTEGVVMGVANNPLIIGTQSYERDLKSALYVTGIKSTEGDTTINLWEVAGIKRLLGIKGWRHTTEDSVIVEENPTVTVNNGIATVTTSAENATQKRVILLIGV